MGERYYTLRPTKDLVFINITIKMSYCDIVPVIFSSLVIKMVIDLVPLICNQLTLFAIISVEKNN